MPKSVISVYPELFHYTTAAGLKGIVENGDVWATNARYLNDHTESKLYFQNRLPEVVRQEANAIVRSWEGNVDLMQQMDEFGGSEVVVDDAVEKICRNMRDSTSRDNDAYFFCLSIPEGQAVLEHGLLSQWRGYGGDGGYAVVFDTSGLERLLRLEEEKFAYRHMQWGDVFYEGSKEDHPAFEDVEGAERQLAAGIRSILENTWPELATETYRSAMMLSSLYKHSGFSEEREVRVVAVPSMQDPSESSEEKARKEVSFFLRNGTLVPHLRLFAGLDARNLPINRVIVGPHIDAPLRRDSATKLLRENGYDVGATMSGIPFNGR